MKRNAAYALAAFGVINLLLIIVCIATPDWLEHDEIGISYSIWHSIGTDVNALRAVRAFMMLGLFSQVTAIILCALLAHKKVRNKVYSEIAFSLTGLFLGIGLVVFVAKYGTHEWFYLGYSYVLGWISSVLAFILGISVEVLAKYK